MTTPFALAALFVPTTLAGPALPAGAAATLEARWPGAELREVEQEGALWEVELRSAEGVSLEVLLQADGRVLHFFDEADEEAIALDALPEPVRAAALKAWPGAELLEAEREGAAYEVTLRSAEGSRMEALFRADGSLIARDAEAADGDDDDADEG
jgi:hypothetical protein